MKQSSGKNQMATEVARDVLAALEDMDTGDKVTVEVKMTGPDRFNI